MEADIESVRVQTRERLRNLDLFILDNTIRESTVGQFRSHTLEKRIKLYRQVQKCGMTSIIVATFAHMTRVDDQFCQWLKDEGEDFSKIFSFCEVSEGIVDGAYDVETIPIALRMNKKYGIYNTFLEIELADPDIEWGTKCTIDDVCKLMLNRMDWVYENLNAKARILINFRDLPACMQQAPERLLAVVSFLAKMREEKRMFAIAFEDPTGDCLPEELKTWTAIVREVMDTNGWKSGKLLIHIHQKWQLQTAATINCLSAGADGVWSSICDEGAGLGHASSSVTLMNLIRLGNEKVLETYNCKEFRKAAIEVTKILTGQQPHPKQVVYGSRALDLVFSSLRNRKFDIRQFYGEDPVKYISNLSSNEIILDHLVNLFGENPQFTIAMAQKMKTKMLEDLRADPPRKEEYVTAMGIAVLFDRAGGKLTEKMSEAITTVELKQPQHEAIVKEIRELWDEWDLREVHKRDDNLPLDLFYDGFMSPYFGCHRCPNTKKALEAIDIDINGYVDWNEVMIYIKWALHKCPDVANGDQALSIAIEKGIVPAMRNEKLKIIEGHI